MYWRPSSSSVIEILWPLGVPAYFSRQFLPLHVNSIHFGVFELTVYSSISVLGAIAIIGLLSLWDIMIREVGNRVFSHEYISLVADKSEVIPRNVLVESACRGHIRIRHDQP